MMKRFSAFLLNIFSVACVSIFVSCGFSVKDESNIEGSYGIVEVSVGNGARCVRPYAKDGVAYNLWFFNMEGKTEAEILKSVESADFDKSVSIESGSTSVTCALEAGSYLVYVKSEECHSYYDNYFFQGHTVFSIVAGETYSFSVSVSPVSTSLDPSGNGYLSLTIHFDREESLGTEAENYEFLLQVKNLETLEATEENLVYDTGSEAFTPSSISLPAGLYYCSMYCLNENDTRVCDFFFKNDSCVEIVKGMTTVLDEVIVKRAELKRYVVNSSEDEYKYNGISSEYRALLSDCIKDYGTCGYAEFCMPEYDYGNYEQNAIIDGTLISEESAFTITQCMGGNSGHTGGMSVNLIITVKGRVITVKTECESEYQYNGPVFILENAGDIRVVSGVTGRDLTTTTLDDGSVEYLF